MEKCKCSLVSMEHGLSRALGVEPLDDNTCLDVPNSQCTPKLLLAPGYKVSIGTDVGLHQQNKSPHLEQ